VCNEKGRTTIFPGTIQSSTVATSKPGRICHPKTPNLLAYLADVHVFAASDPRDIIHANLGLSSINYGIRFNYSKDNSVEDVLVDIGRKIEDRSGSLTTFRYALVFRGEEIPKLHHGL
jgi:hypothetical protein